MADWRRFSHDLAACERRRATVMEQAEELQAVTAEAERRMRSVDADTTDLETQLHDAEATSAHVHQELARSQSTVNHEYQRSEELAHEIQRYRRQWQAMTTWCRRPWRTTAAA